MFTFLEVAYAFVLQVVIFSETLTPLSVLGAVVVFLGRAFNLWKEATTQTTAAPGPGRLLSRWPTRTGGRWSVTVWFAQSSVEDPASGVVPRQEVRRLTHPLLLSKRPLAAGKNAYGNGSGEWVFAGDDVEIETSMKSGTRSTV